MYYLCLFLCVCVFNMDTYVNIYLILSLVAYLVCLHTSSREECETSV